MDARQAYGTPWWTGGYKTWGKGKGSQSQRSGNVSICTEQHTSLLSLASNLIPLITVPFPFLVIFSFYVFVSFDLEAAIFPPNAERHRDELCMEWL